MEEDASSNNGGLRPISQPNLASRFPSLRRLNSSEPYRHRSLPAEPSSGSDGGSETTFAVLYDDGPDYHVGHYDEAGSMGTGQRPESSTSFAPSFRTRDSRVFSDDHDIDRNPDLLANQRLLAEGYMNNTNDPYLDNPSPAYNQTFSQETLTSTNYNNTYGNEKSGMSLYDRPVSSHSRQSWCTCDEDHGHGHGSKPFETDVEGQREPSTPTPFLSGEEKKAAAAANAGQNAGPGGDKKGPGGPGGPGKGPGGPGGPPGGGPPGLPPFPPGFPDELKVSFNIACAQ